MRWLPAHLAAAAAAMALLVGVPIGVAAGLALASSSDTVWTAIARVHLLLELATSAAWVGGVFSPLAWAAARFPQVRAAPLATAVTALAFVVGWLGFYRAEATLERALYSAQYAVLLLLAFLLFDFVASWLGPAGERQSASRRD